MTPWESMLQTCNGHWDWLLDITWFLWLYKQRHFASTRERFFIFTCQTRGREMSSWKTSHLFIALTHSVSFFLNTWTHTHSHTQRDDIIECHSSHLGVRGSSPLCSHHFLEPVGLLRKRTLMWFSLKREKRMSGRPRRISVLPQNKIKTNRQVFTSKIPNILSRWQDFELDGLCLSGCAAALSSSTAPRDEAALTWP